MFSNVTDAHVSTCVYATVLDVSLSFMFFGAKLNSIACSSECRILVLTFAQWSSRLVNIAGSVQILCDTCNCHYRVSMRRLFFPVYVRPCLLLVHLHVLDISALLPLLYFVVGASRWQFFCFHLKIKRHNQCRQSKNLHTHLRARLTAHTLFVFRALPCHYQKRV